MKSRSRSTLNRAASASNIQSIPHMTLSPEEIYNMATRKCDWGVEGYECPKLHFDYPQVMWMKKVALIAKKCPRNWPPKDWPGKKDNPDIKVPPHRWNYLDDLEKWCNSFYDAKRAEEILEENPIEESKPNKIKDRRRSEFLKNYKEKMEREKNKKFYYEEKEDMIAEIKEKADENTKKQAMTTEERNKRRYKKGRCGTSRCDRITPGCEAEYNGEQIPFYKTYHREDATDKERKRLFFPDKTCMLRKYPAWKINPVKKKNEYLATRNELLKEKLEDYMSAKDLSSKDLWVNIQKSFHDVTHKGEILMKIQPQTKYNEEEHYQSMRENNPIIHIGPSHYWKVPKMSRAASVRRMSESKLLAKAATEDEKGNKTYYMSIKKTDKRVYKSGMRKSIY